LEEEDYSVGQLYVDEYVSEVPYVPTPSAEAKAAGRVNALGIERSPDDNEQLYDAIEAWMGTPYKYGGTTKEGVDCSAFVGHIYQEVYQRRLHRVANDMQQDATLITKSELREGDIVFFTNSKGRVSHVGIYLKDGLFVHSSTSRGVIISRLDDSYWSKHFYKGGRVL
jgi:lipoprotein Spr